MPYLARHLSTFFSVVLHPLLLPTYIFGAIFLFIPTLASPIPADWLWQLWLLVVGSTLLIPCCCVALLYRLGIVSSITIEGRKDRFIPHIFSTCVYAAVCWLFYTRIPFNLNLFYIMASITICMAIVTVVTFYWKISAHSTGMGGLCAFFLGLYFLFPQIETYFLWLIGLVLAGTVMSARLYLNIHTQLQVYTGFFVGFFIGLAGMWHVR